GMGESLERHRRDEDRRCDARAEHGRARVDRADVDEYAWPQLPPRERRQVLPQRRLVAGAAAEVLPRVLVEALARKRLVVVNVQGFHANNSVSSSRSTGRSSAAQTGSRCAGLRGPTTTAPTSGFARIHASASVAGSPRCASCSSPAKTSSRTNAVYGSGRNVIREPAANSALRVYLPVSQPPASGLKA